MTHRTPLVLTREPLAPGIDLGIDLVDSRNGQVLAWAPNYTAFPLARYLNRIFPDAALAPNHEALKRELPRYMEEASSERA